jgi:polyisoprenoid-binding protein YceI
MFKRTALAIAFLGFCIVAAPAAAEKVRYKLDPNHTIVLASWNHFGFSNPVANFGQVDGQLDYDPANPAASGVRVVLPLTGLNSFVPKFDEHLRSADFFDAARYPTVVFQSTRTEAAGEGKLKVTGDLTIRDITKPVVLDVTLNKAGIRQGRPAVGFDATTTIRRSEFGLGLYAPNVSDEVTLRISTEATVPKSDAEKKADAEKAAAEQATAGKGAEKK